MADDITALKEFVIKEQVDLTVVGPEVPLANGIVDEFRKAKMKIFGPTKNASPAGIEQDLFEGCDGLGQDSNGAGEEL